MQRNFLWLAVLTIALSPVRLGADEPPEKKNEATKEPSVWMKLKLEYSQRILEGVTKADYELIEQNATNMRALTKVESFIRGRWDGYRNQLDSFNQANDELIRQARKENVDGAALSFTQLTISCVTCHKRLREAEQPATRSSTAR